MIIHSIRGRLGSLLMLSCTTGILFSFVAGTYLSYLQVPKLFMGLPIIFIIVFIFLPETPQYHISRKDNEVSLFFSLSHWRCKMKSFPETASIKCSLPITQSAKRSLKFYKNCTCTDVNACDELSRVFDDLVQTAEKNAKKPNDPATVSDLCKSLSRSCQSTGNLQMLILSNWCLHFLLNQLIVYSLYLLHISVAWDSVKALLICFSLTAINLFSGTFAMMNYTANIFKASGSDLDPHTSSIIVAVIQIIGVYCATNLVDRVGRKILLLFSSSGAFLGLTCLGTYSYLSMSGVDLSAVNWIPLASFSTFVFISCFGILPLPFIITAEVLPPKVDQTLAILSIF